MSTEIPVRRIAFDKYILEFVVTCPNSVRVTLLSDKDPTLVNTEYITIASKGFLREASEDGCDMEYVQVFADRVYSASLLWGTEAILSNKETIALADALRIVLPPGIEV